MCSLLNKQLLLSKSIESILIQTKEKSKSVNRQHAPDFDQDNDVFSFNTDRDIRYSNSPSGVFHDSLVLFTQQWVGIRQACGALPGDKLAINGQHYWKADEVRKIAQILCDRKIKRVFSHGMAPSTSVLLRALKSVMPEVKFFGVWHGTMAGWSAKEEVELFKDFINLANGGVFERVGFLRSGMNKISDKAFNSIIFNIPPVVNIPRMSESFSINPIRCIFPSWNNHWKNMYTNMLGASSSPHVSMIYSYNDVDKELIDKVAVVPFGGYEKHLIRLSQVDLCLTVSINDCQPMTELEGLSVGTPSLRGDLDFDTLTKHEYETVFTVHQYLNPEAIRIKIEQLTLHKSSYISELVEDYRAMLRNECFRRYERFVS